MRAALTLLLCLVLATPALAGQAQFTAVVITVTDGDTITVLTQDKQQSKIRLYGIDAPKRGHAFGNRAKQTTMDAVHGKNVTVQPIEKDHHQTLAVVFMPGGRSLSEHLVRAGLASIDTQHCTQEDICDSLRRLEKSAKAQKRGMWEDRTPVPQQGLPVLPGGGTPNVPGGAPK